MRHTWTEAALPARVSFSSLEQRPPTPGQPHLVLQEAAGGIHQRINTYRKQRSMLVGILFSVLLDQLLVSRGNTSEDSYSLLVCAAFYSFSVRLSMLCHSEYGRVCVS